MSKCDLYVMFDQDDRSYHPGDEVVGVAKVVVNRDIKSKKIFLQFMWRTHGRGNRSEGDVQEIVLADEAPLQAGEDMMFPFRFIVPDGPVSYRGTLLNVDWYVRLQVGVPWAIDPKLDEEFFVTRNPEDTERVLSQGDPAVLERLHVGSIVTHRGIPVGCLFIVGVGFLLFGILLMLISMAPSEGGGWMWMVNGGVASVIGIAMILVSQRNKLAARKVGAVELSITSGELRAGERIEVQLKCNPRRPGAIDKISSKLLCQEVVVSGSGSNRKTHRHIVYEDVQGGSTETISAAAPVVGIRGAGITRSFTHVLPADAGGTFASSDNELRWSVKVQISVPRWPDWVEERNLTVLP